MGELDGQVAIVTGGGTGFGRAIAQVLAAAGATVTVVGRRAAELDATVASITAAGCRAVAFPADITDWAALQQLVARTAAHLGPVDLLVNNAGAVSPLAPLWEIDPEEWRRNVEVNLTGTVLCMRAVLPGMVARQRGRIITISSHGIKGPVPYFAAYASTKLAVVKVMETLAVEVREHGIAVFTVFPGTAWTEMQQELRRSPWGRRVFGDEARFRQSTHTPLDRPGELCRFLASGAADALSGRIFDVVDDEQALVGRAADVVERDLHAFRLRT